MERERTAEKIHPNQVINNAVNYYLLAAIEDGLLKQKGGTKPMVGIIEHLAQSGAFEKGNEFPKKEVFEAEKDQVLELGKTALDALDQKRDIKELAKGKFDPRLIAYAPQALLVYSYLPLLTNLKDIVIGKKEYGFGKELNRLQPHNSLASGEMMKKASKNIAKEIGRLVTERKFNNVGILELGCGNASFSASVVEEFKAQGMETPFILATDLDPATQVSAEKLFEEKGIIQNLNLMKVDMGNFGDLMRAAKKLEGKSVIVHIGYILHENRKLAEDTLAGLTRAFDSHNIIFAFSEYYRQDVITPEIPLWFQTLHEITQDLFDKSEFMQFVSKNGMLNFSELAHNVSRDTEEVVNSTTFWEMQNNYYYFPMTQLSMKIEG